MRRFTAATGSGGGIQVANRLPWGLSGRKARTPRFNRPTLVVGLAVLAFAAHGADAPESAANPYAELSNEQLAGVADEWEELSQNQRRWFFSEVRKRLLAKERLPIRSRSRFGQAIRRPDATAAGAKPKPVRGEGEDANAYGLGFERRRQLRPQAERVPAPEHSRLPGRP